MASDVWGHTTDNNGCIVQDVNPRLFTMIINYLRLKALLPASNAVPPIVIYAEDRVSLENILSYYMMSDMPVEILK